METVVTLASAVILEISESAEAMAQWVPTVGSVETVGPAIMPAISMLPFPTAILICTTTKPTAAQEDREGLEVQVEWVVAEAREAMAVMVLPAVAKLAVEEAPPEEATAGKEAPVGPGAGEDTAVSRERCTAQHPSKHP